MSPLRQRMTDAMTVRGLSARTIECYTEAIARPSRHHGDTNPARLATERGVPAASGRHRLKP